MFAAIPFFGLTTAEVMGIPLDPWAILVCMGFIIGLEFGRYRAIRLGIEPRDLVDGAVVTVVTGFVIGHVFTVAFYFPERLHGGMQTWSDTLVFFRTGFPPTYAPCTFDEAKMCVEEAGRLVVYSEPSQGMWAILKVWTGFSSMGGFVGAVIGSVVFYTKIRPRPYFRYADVITFGFPFGWVFGRMGCAVVHDHIGKVTTWPTGMDFDAGYRNLAWFQGDPYPWASGLRHDLGLYEMVLTLPICALFLYLGRKDWPPGFFTALFGALYMPVRFALDFLRNTDLQHQDVRWWSLTPAQWGSVVFFVVCVAILYRLDFKGHRPWPMDGKPNQAQRALEQEA